MNLTLDMTQKYLSDFMKKTQFPDFYRDTLKSNGALVWWGGDLQFSHKQF